MQMQQLSSVRFGKQTVYLCKPKISIRSVPDPDSHLPPGSPSRLNHLLGVAKLLSSDGACLRGLISDIKRKYPVKMEGAVKVVPAGDDLFFIIEGTPEAGEKDASELPVSELKRKNSKNENPIILYIESMYHESGGLNPFRVSA